MRLWSIHPRYLDSKGLVALWREGLLAQKVLQGKTKGYRYHPQLDRFKNTENPVSSIGAYLYHVYLESRERNYNFQLSKIEIIEDVPRIRISKNLLHSEFQHLLGKLEQRDSDRYQQLLKITNIIPHPSFELSSTE
ncbi:MAG: pyrimidine dimer DNA glycosylase/endonuclease V [Candidatus Thorarchaeota archaeon]